MNVPLEVSYRDVDKTESLDDLIRSQTDKLERICDYVSSCRVSIEKTQKHLSSGNPYRVRVDVTVPPSHELVSSQEPGYGDMHKELPAVIRDVYSGIERQLRKLVEKQRQDVKTHEDQETTAIVSTIFPEEGYGFLQSVEDSSEIYFHRNSVVPDGDFERMTVGTGTWFRAEVGEKGLQATTVRITDKPGERS